MKTLKTMLCAVFTLLLVNTTATVADSSNFAGPYVGVSASGYGLQMDGTSRTSPTAGTWEEDNVSIGQVAPVTGLEVGYALPLGTSMLIDVNGTYHQGAAQMDFSNDDPDSQQDVSFAVDDLRTFSIAPTLVLSDTSSVYLKVGITEADIAVTGDITTPGDLSGTTWAIGQRSVLDSGIFVKTEAGFTDYNGISAHGKGNNIDTSNTYSAEPTVAYGSVSIGFRF
tara:strand:- start:736 stop:1410 length:675 start_codon:yes stop_codon:yes gene_type:complete